MGLGRKPFLNWPYHLLSRLEDPWQRGNTWSALGAGTARGPCSRRMPKLPAPLEAAIFGSISLSLLKAAHWRLIYPWPKCWSLITSSVSWSRSPGSLFIDEVLVSLEQKLPYSERGAWAPSRDK